MNKGKSPDVRRGPLVKVRHILLMGLMMTVVVTLPLVLVWKEAYRTEISVKHKECTDSLQVLRREAARLALVADSLSDVRRIERIARTALGLEYPESDRTAVVGPPPRGGLHRRALMGLEFFAILRKSLQGGDTG